jgi:hypothetical protein
MPIRLNTSLITSSSRKRLAIAVATLAAAATSAAGAGEHGENLRGFSGSNQQGFSGSNATVQGFSGSNQQGFSGSNASLRGFSGSNAQGFGGSTNNGRGFSGSNEQGFSGSNASLRGFSGSNAQGFGGSNGSMRGFSRSDQQGFSGSNATLQEFSGSNEQGFSGSNASMRGFSGSNEHGFSGSNSAGRFATGFRLAAMGVVDAVFEDRDSATLTVAGQSFSVAREDVFAFRLGDYVVAGSTAADALAVVYHVGMPYVPGVSAVRVKAPVDSVDTARGSVTAGALLIDYTAHLSVDPNLEPLPGQTVHVAGTQPAPRGALVVNPSGYGISLDRAAATERTDRQ